MKTYLLLGIAAALVSAARGACDACVDGRCLRKQPLPDSTGRVRDGNGDINRNTTVYYAITRKSGQHYNDITQCNLNTQTCNATVVPWKVWGLIVDQRTGDLYVNGDVSHGLFKVDLVKKEQTLLFDEEIMYATFKDKVYFSTLKSSGIYTYDGGIQQIVPGTEDYVVSEFVVDKNNDIYFKDVHDEAIKQLKYRTGTANYFCERWNHLSTDKDGNVMVISQSSLAVYRVVNDELVEVGALTEWVKELLFDGDNNFIYVASEGSGRYYLTPVTDVQCSIVRGGTQHRQIISKPIITTTPETVVSTFTSTTPAHETSNAYTR